MLAILNEFEGGSVTSLNIFSPLRYLIILKNDRLILFPIIASIVLYCIVFNLPTVSRKFVKKKTNLIIYLHAFTLIFAWGGNFLPFVPSATSFMILLFCLLLVCLFVSKEPVKTVPRRIRMLLVGYLAITVLGIASSMIGFNDVRSTIPLWSQVTLAIKTGDGVLVVYFLFRNQWGVPEFERMFRLIFWISFIVSLECLGGFYFQLFPISSPGRGRFASWFVGRHHFTAGLGLFLTFSSLYFQAVTLKKRYWLMGILGFLLTFSSISRQALLGLFVGLVFFFFLGYLRRSNNNMFKKVMIVFTLVIGLAVSVYLTDKKASEYRPMFHTYDLGFWDRVAKYGRALDIIAVHPLLGAGNGLSQYYMYSSHVPMIFPNLIAGEYKITGFWGARPDLVDTFKASELSLDRFGVQTIHNLILQFAVDNGLPGFLVCIVLIFGMMKVIWFFVKGTRRIRYGSKWLPIMALCALVLSTFIYIQTTSKFEPIWYFGFLGSFLYIYYLQAKIYLRGTAGFSSRRDKRGEGNEMGVDVSNHGGGVL